MYLRIKTPPLLLGYSGVSFVYLRDQDSTRLLGTSQDNLNWRLITPYGKWGQGIEYRKDHYSPLLLIYQGVFKWRIIVHHGSLGVCTVPDDYDSSWLLGYKGVFNRRIIALRGTLGTRECVPQDHDSQWLIGYKDCVPGLGSLVTRECLTENHDSPNLPGYKTVCTSGSRLFGPKWHSLRSCHFRTQKSLDFQGPPLPMPLVMMLHPSKSLRTAP